MSSKLDKTTLREWKEAGNGSDLPKLEEFIEFFKYKVDLLQSIEQTSINKYSTSSNSNQRQFSKDSGRGQKGQQSNFLVNTPNQSSNFIKCNFCGNNHSIYKCQDFLNLSVHDRITKVNQLKLCKNCLRIGHTVDKCYLNPCKICKQSHNKTLKHNSLLHYDTTVHNSTNTDLNLLARSNNPGFKLVNKNISNNLNQVLLSTLMC